MIFKILVTLFLGVMFAMLFSSRHGYILRIPVLLGIVVGMICVWRVDAATAVANFLGIGRAADLVFYCCVMLGFYCIFTLYLKLEKSNENLTILVRKIAIDHAARAGADSSGGGDIAKERHEADIDMAEHG